MRSARRNIGDRSASRSSSPAEGRPDNRRRSLFICQIMCPANSRGATIVVYRVLVSPRAFGSCGCNCPTMQRTSNGKLLNSLNGISNDRTHNAEVEGSIPLSPPQEKNCNRWMFDQRRHLAERTGVQELCLRIRSCDLHIVEHDPLLMQSYDIGTFSAYYRSLFTQCRCAIPCMGG